MRNRILFLTFELPPEIPGGIASVAADKIRGFHELGFRLFAVGPSARVSVHKRDLPAAFLPIPVRGNSAKFVLTVLWALFVAVLIRPRLVYAMSGTYSGMAAWLVSRLFHIPYFVMAHGNEFLRFEHRKRARDLIRRVFSGARAIMAVSRYTGREVARIYAIPSSRIHVVYNGVDAKRFAPAGAREVESIRSRLDVPSRALLLLTVSRIDRRKNHATVLKAISHLIASGRIGSDSVRYVIGGTGPRLGHLKQLSSELGVDNVVRYVGFVPDSELPVLYTAADLFVMPSVLLPEEGSVEGFGLVYVEAGLCGTTALGGQAGGVSDAIEHGRTGWVVDGADQSAVEEALVRANAHREQLAQMGQEARRYYLERLTLRRVLENEHRIISGSLKP